MSSSYPYGYQFEWPFFSIFKIKFEDKQASSNWNDSDPYPIKYEVSIMHISASFATRGTVKSTDQGQQVSKQ